MKTFKDEEEQELSEDEDMLTFEIMDTGKTSQQHYEAYREEVERMSLENLISFDVATPTPAPTKVWPSISIQQGNSLISI